MHWPFYIIHDHHFSHLLFIWKNELLRVDFKVFFYEKNLPLDYSCNSHDHDHQWVDLIMAWQPVRQNKMEHKVVRLV